MTDVTCCEKCCKPLDDHPLIDVSNVKVLQMCDRHPKWVRVEPGTVIPAGQPYRVEWPEWDEMYASEYVIDESFTVTTERTPYFIDSSWKPPLVLPTSPCVIRAELRGPIKHRILFGHPDPGEEQGMNFCRAEDGLGYDAEDIISFEVLWTEGERGKDALVPWELIDKLRDAYPPDPGTYMTPVDYFLREVVMDR